jgi:hypothetical protein
MPIMSDNLVYRNREAVPIGLTPAGRPPAPDWRLSQPGRH